MPEDKNPYTTEENPVVQVTEQGEAAPELPESLIEKAGSNEGLSFEEMKQLSKSRSISAQAMRYRKQLRAKEAELDQIAVWLGEFYKQVQEKRKA